MLVPLTILYAYSYSMHSIILLVLIVFFLQLTAYSLQAFSRYAGVIFP
jgi:hypothetical protein